MRFRTLLRKASATVSALPNPLQKTLALLGAHIWGYVPGAEGNGLTNRRAGKDTGSIETDPERVKAATLGSWFFAAQPK